MADEKKPKENSNKEEKNDDKNGDKKEDKKKSSGSIASPEGILMLCVAGIIDIISFIPVINVISGVLGFIVIGGWLIIMRPGQLAKNAVKRIAFRIIVVCFMEFVPVLSVAPTWTWFVYKTLKEG